MPTGSNLQARGLDKGKAAETWVLENQMPSNNCTVIFSNQEQYPAHLYFWRQPLSLEHGGLGDKVNEVIIRQLRLHKGDRRTRSSSGRLHGSTGTDAETTRFAGDDEAQQAYAEQAKALAHAGADFLLIETQFDINEAGLPFKEPFQFVISQSSVSFTTTVGPKP